LAFGAVAAPTEEDLQALRLRIGKLSERLEEKEETKKEARDALRASERAISEANRSLAELQGGALKIRSTEGVGTIVSVRIPVKKAQPAVKAAA